MSAATSQGAACSGCQAGRYTSAVGATACLSCGKGTFISMLGVSVCSQCQQGAFASSIGASSCIACQPGTTNAGPGASNCTVCPNTLAAQAYFTVQCVLLCNVGYYVAGAVCSRCSDSSSCGAGLYRPNCTGGLNNDQTCSGQCTTCLPGAFSPARLETIRAQDARGAAAWGTS